MKKDKLKKESGFTLLESLVSISVLMLSMVAVISVVASTLSISGNIQHRVTATYLAQDAMEYVKNIRDKNFLGGADWNTGLEHCISIDGYGCRINTTILDPDTPGAVVNCPAGGCLPIQTIVEDSSGATVGYGYGDVEGVFDFASHTYSDSIYTRQIVIEYDEMVDPYEMRVFVFVKWKAKEALDEKTYQLSNTLYEWI